MTDKPGFTVEEILHVKNSGNNLVAVKMLRAETGCTFQEATATLRDGNIADLPTFRELRARRKAERYGPQLFETLRDVLKESRRVVHPDSTDERLFNIDRIARVAIEEIEKE